MTFKSDLNAVRGYSSRSYAGLGTQMNADPSTFPVIFGGFTSSITWTAWPRTPTSGFVYFIVVLSPFLRMFDHCASTSRRNLSGPYALASRDTLASPLNDDGATSIKPRRAKSRSHNSRETVRYKCTM
jgi:hypothetical protein